MLIILWGNRVNSDSIHDEIFLHEYTHIELHVIITTTLCQSESVSRLFISRSILCFYLFINKYLSGVFTL